MSRAFKLLVGVVLVGHQAFAQTPPPGAQRAPAAGGPTAGPTDVDISVPRKSKLNAEDMMTQSRDYRARVQEILLRIQSLQEQARKQKDIIRLNCLADKLVQAKVNLNIADQAMGSVQEAIGRKDEPGSVHEFTRITIVHQKAQVLGAEAEACVGEDLSFVGATKVEVTIDPNITPTDTTTPKFDHQPLDRPQQASPHI